MTQINKAEALAAIAALSQEFLEGGSPTAVKVLNLAADHLNAIPAHGAHGVDAVLDAAHDYLMQQYGHSPLKHPVDRARILATLAPTDAAQAREAALQLAVTVVRQALVDAAFNYTHDKALSSAMFKAETHATNAILALIGETRT